MISYIKGVIAFRSADSIIVEKDGIGYTINFSQQDKVNINDQVMIFTYLHVREDDLSLFGFLSFEDLEFFKRLISVKGIGPKMAMNMFIRSDSSKMISAIEEGDVNYLKTLPGIGAKTASQVILDLKGKLIANSIDKVVTNEKVAEAMSGLKNLGYKVTELNGIEKQLVEVSSDKSVSELIRLGLQLLLKSKGM